MSHPFPINGDLDDRDDRDDRDTWTPENWPAEYHKPLMEDEDRWWYAFGLIGGSSVEVRVYYAGFIDCTEVVLHDVDHADVPRLCHTVYLAVKTGDVRGHG